MCVCVCVCERERERSFSIITVIEEVLHRPNAAITHTQWQGVFPYTYIYIYVCVHVCFHPEPFSYGKMNLDLQAYTWWHGDRERMQKELEVTDVMDSLGTSMNVAVSDCFSGCPNSGIVIALVQDLREGQLT